MDSILYVFYPKILGPESPIKHFFKGPTSVLRPLSNSWIIIIIVWFIYSPLSDPNLDCYWVGAVPKVQQ